MENISPKQNIVCYTNEAKSLIKKTIKYGGFDQTFYLKGPSGIGKSEMANQLAEELDAELFDIRLGLYDTIDLNGIGIPDIEKQLAIFTRPIFLPPEDGKGKRFIILLDEMNHADEKLLGSAYQMTLERRIGTHKLPDNVLIIAAGNTKTDNGIAFNLPSPLVNRFININIMPNIDDWLIYAKENGIDWKIMSFLKSNPEYLHKFVANSEEDNFPTPRNWVKLNKFINEFKEDERFMELILNGMFGYGTYIAFKEYLKLINKTPLMKDIINGKYNITLGSELSDSYAFSMLASSYVRNNIDSINNFEFINILKYINIQESNKEVMYMLGAELMTIINKESKKIDIKLEELKKLKNVDEEKGKLLKRKENVNQLHYQIFKTDQMSLNKKFIQRLSDFKKSIA